MRQPPIVQVPADKLVIATDNHARVRAGHCVVCGKYGWIKDHPNGLPYNGLQSYSLRHKQDCPVGHVLDKNGEWLIC